MRYIPIMKIWLALGGLFGLAFGVWLSQVADNLHLLDGAGIGLVTGLVSALAFACIPWRAMGRREF